jgi:FkbM family methyltransferase
MKLSALVYYARSIPNLLLNVAPHIQVVQLFMGKARAGPLTVRLRGSGLQFRVRTAMDVWVIKETCLDRDYEAVTPLQDGWIIIDIGAGLGDFTVYAARRNPHGRVYAYEPFPESVDLLKHNLALNNVTQVEIQTVAVAGQSGTLTLNVGDAEAVQHSTMLGGAHTIEVAAVTLEQIFATHGLQCCDLLKLDVEGAEYGILLTADASLLKKIKRIVLEYHDNTPAGRHEVLSNFLIERGFGVELRRNPVHDYLGYLYAMNLENA